MSPICAEYVLAHSVEQALLALRVSSAERGPARIVAGGSDLLLELQQGNHPAVNTLVDVTGIPEMCQLELRGSSLFIGASVTISRLVHSPLAREHAQALADAAVMMANPQVCNVATIGGNVAHALPAADGTISLLALDAHAEIANLNGRRKVPLRALFNGPGISTLDPRADLLVGFYIPGHQRGQASAFARRVNPQGIALALLNMALWVQREGERVRDIRIAAGPSGPVPLRMAGAENALKGQSPTAEARALALDEILQEAHFRTSLHRATAEYRRHIAGVLLEEALSSAWQRAGER